MTPAVDRNLRLKEPPCRQNECRPILQQDPGEQVPGTSCRQSIPRGAWVLLPDSQRRFRSRLPHGRRPGRRSGHGAIGSARGRRAAAGAL